MKKGDIEAFKLLEEFVRICAEAGKGVLDREKAPIMIPLGFLQASAKTLGLEKVRDDVPVYYFKDHFPDLPGEDSYDAIFWTAMREVDGDPEKVWQMFQRFQ